MKIGDTMMTQIYLIRHSETMNNIINILNTDDFQIQNEKNPLSVEGEEQAKSLSLTDEMQNIDLVISSNYVRAISTAKYIAHHNKIDLNIIEDFGERKFGVNSWNEKPKNFTQKQIEDESFKVSRGESRNETANRMYNALISVIEKNKGKRIAIISHATAITYLFMKMFNSNGLTIKYGNNLLMDRNSKWNAPEVFKLIYEDNELVSIENVRNFNEK